MDGSLSANKRYQINICHTHIVLGGNDSSYHCVGQGWAERGRSGGKTGRCRAWNKHLIITIIQRQSKAACQSWNGNFIAVQGNWSRQGLKVVWSEGPVEKEEGPCHHLPVPLNQKAPEDHKGKPKAETNQGSGPGDTVGEARKTEVTEAGESSRPSMIVAKY
jgi:hypothetical protein